jgi:hypothetical protein
MQLSGTWLAPTPAVPISERMLQSMSMRGFCWGMLLEIALRDSLAWGMLLELSTNKYRLQRTKRLRQLFEQMDKQKTGALTLDQFKEYMARENPRSVERAAAIFAAMGNRHHECGEEGCKAPTVSFLEVLHQLQRGLSLHKNPAVCFCVVGNKIGFKNGGHLCTSELM